MSDPLCLSTYFVEQKHRGWEGGCCLKYHTKSHLHFIIIYSFLPNYVYALIVQLNVKRNKIKHIFAQMYNIPLSLFLTNSIISFFNYILNSLSPWNMS